MNNPIEIGITKRALCIDSRNDEKVISNTFALNHSGESNWISRTYPRCQIV
jgi:hypothetical protein